MTSTTSYYSRPSGTSAYTRHATSRYNFDSSPTSTSGNSSSSSGLTSSRFYKPSALSTASSSSLRTRSSYDLNSSGSTYRLPPSSATSSSSASSSSSSSFTPKSYTSSYLTNRYSGSSSGYSSSSSSSSTPVTLTRFHRRTSLDYHNDSSDTHSIGSSSIGSSISSKTSTPIAAKLPTAGLSNLGNTCYMNSVIQALFATRQLREFVVSGIASGSIYSALSRLFKDMSSSIRSGYTNPSSFRSSFIQYENKFRGYEQQDAQEFLRYLINGLAEEVNKAKSRPKRPMIEPKSSQEAWNQYRERVDDSKLMDIFVGQFSSVIKCSDCSNESSCWDPFWDLSLAVPRYRNRVDVEECMKSFTESETLDGSEQPFCSQCKKHRRSTKRLSVVRQPKILIIHLKKFSNDGYKLSSDITVNERLHISDVHYSLYACVCHHGYSSRSGHYTAYCQYDSKWYHMNDEHVSDVTDSFSMSTLKDAYVLFYRQAGGSNSHSSSHSSQDSSKSSTSSSSGYSSSSSYSSRL